MKKKKKCHSRSAQTILDLPCRGHSRSRDEGRRATSSVLSYEPDAGFHTDRTGPPPGGLRRMCDVGGTGAHLLVGSAVVGVDVPHPTNSPRTAQSTGSGDGPNPHAVRVQTISFVAFIDASWGRRQGGKRSCCRYIYMQAHCLGTAKQGAAPDLVSEDDDHCRQMAVVSACIASADSSSCIRFVSVFARAWTHSKSLHNPTKWFRKTLALNKHDPRGHAKKQL